MNDDDNQDDGGYVILWGVIAVIVWSVAGYLWWTA